mmetsp:Transcript_68630/g.143206  ORF Transcript_68630/g.143206 Transcript_68630/m.143206 type:complete len:122 (-) Transcript_68630:195-560(-)|eukprot:CAMPEP_0181309732 /NCGR_PEP_ID=MMETSP1101-20121128/12175_1 /TAXON_ID=46948 /ORGANISM="Rhodomonas abbreviata, Strain Caron Lab Isolate" /LENGTH=121 /DNA_ID=CAMNT_0023416245 /DNA_START=219 /DNA_END=584 /DNA_ORIENTATION=+
MSSDSKKYAIRPQFHKKFKPMQVKEIIQKCLDDKLTGQKYHVDKASKFSRELADTIKQELKDLQWDRYKYVVQVVIGEQRGEGVKMGSRQFWDVETDNLAQATFTNDSIFAAAVAYGVYLY